jgi:predicted lipid-binding transport protein (Tim44 family)
MSFLLPMAEAAAPSIIGSVAGGLTSSLLGGGLSGMTSGAMSGSNASLSGMLSANSAFQTGLMGQEMGAQDQLDLQATVFDEAMDQQSENMREINSLRDAQMAQRKADDGITKKFIQSIGE